MHYPSLYFDLLFVLFNTQMWWDNVERVFGLLLLIDICSFFEAYINKTDYQFSCIFTLSETKREQSLRSYLFQPYWFSYKECCIFVERDGERNCWCVWGIGTQWELNCLSGLWLGGDFPRWKDQERPQRDKACMEVSCSRTRANCGSCTYRPRNKAHCSRSGKKAMPQLTENLRKCHSHNQVLSCLWGVQKQSCVERRILHPRWKLQSINSVIIGFRDW